MLKRLLDYNDGEEMDIVVLIKNSQLRHNKKVGIKYESKKRTNKISRKRS